jgi:hypothetical protein
MDIVGELFNAANEPPFDFFHHFVHQESADRALIFSLLLDAGGDAARGLEEA